MRNAIHHPAPALQVRGFTMIEVLVTLIIISLTLLGSAGLQSYAMKMNQGGQLRTQAVVLGLDLLERIEANNTAAVAGQYAVTTLPASYITNCYVTSCSPAALATYDLYQFAQNLTAQLPSGTATITVSGAGPFTYTLQINWVERIAKAESSAVTTGGTTMVTGSGSTERFSYTVSRTVYDRSVVI
jgi:type IV pilus assembly protein PilV